MRRFILRAVLPTFLTIILFSGAIFVIVLPTVERSILEKKREMIRELTNAAWNVLSKFAYDEKSGIVSREEAQRLAISQIKNLHYGAEMKDYFWINDMHPRMVIHPYRIDLNGKDLTDFVDPNGKKLFVEFVKVARESGAGYVDYMWQWKDDSTRIVPKLSYVKAFEPWGWIIGTGIYLDDVHTEIKSITNRLIIASLIILGIVSMLLAFLLWQAFKNEAHRKSAEKALKESEEKYRLVVESAGEKIIMSIDDMPLFANQSMLQFLGYSLEDFTRLRVEDVVSGMADLTSEDWSTAVFRIEGSLKHKDGLTLPMLLSFSKISMQARSGFIVVASDIHEQKERQLRQERLISELHTTLQFLDRTAIDSCEKDFAVVDENTKPDEIGTLLGGKHVALVMDQKGNGCGFMTSSDLVKVREQFCGQDVAQFWRTLALKPPVTVSDRALLYEAYVVHEQNGFVPVFVENDAGQYLGVLTARSFAQIQKYSPTKLVFDIRRARSVEEVTRINKRFPELIGTLVYDGAKVKQISRHITQNADLILEKILQFEIEKLGPPPADFSFLIFGSEARREQTLCTDQDNAILFADVADEKKQETKAYFVHLGQKVCDSLNAAGYYYCKGGIMANNVSWVLSLTEWKEQFAKWITTLEAKDLLNAKIFFDFRSGYGQTALVDELRNWLFRFTEVNPRFFLFLASNILMAEPPLGLLGQFVLEPAEGGRKALNVKRVLTQIVDYARIYALKNKIAATNTAERLHALQETGVFQKANSDELLQAYTFLMQLRIENQVQALRENRKPDNYIDPSKLTLIEQRLLKEVFGQIKTFQAGLSYEFIGMMPQG